MASSYGRFNPFRGVYLIPQSPTGAPDFKTAIQFDGVFSQDGSEDAEVTEQAVEFGDTVINDSIILRPPSFSCTAVFTDTPLRIISVGANGDPVFTIGGAGTDRAIKLFNKTRDGIFRAKKLLIVRTTTAIMPNMVMTQFNWNRDSSSGQAVSLSLSFRTLRLVTTGLVPSVMDTDIQLMGGAGTFQQQ